MYCRPAWPVLPGIFVGFALLTGAAPQGAPQNPAVPSVGDVETLRLTRRVFDNTRNIRVLLPPGYRDPANSQAEYPVLYLTDGIMAFRPDRLNAPGVVSELIRKGGIPLVVVVGIDNGGSTDKSKNPATDRANEFLPFPDVGFPPNNLYAPEPPDPQGKRYPAFLVDEVMPLIKSHYRIKTGAANTGLGGFSYGGVAALYSAMRKPGVFGKLLLESTPLCIGPDRQLLNEALKCARWPDAVSIGVGTKEAPDEAVNAEGKRDVESLHDAIRQKAPTTALKFVSEEGAKHEPSAWRGRLPAALRFLFGRRQEAHEPT